MCGRYALVDTELLAERYGVEYPLLGLTANYNVAPGVEMPTISKNSPNQAILRKWGLVPFWSKDPKIGYKMINARAETIAEKPSFKNALKSRRCIVPASGFYEWRMEAGAKTPYFFKPEQDTLFSFAGLYETWRGPDETVINSYTIITTQANDLTRSYHERMPVILAREDEETWLDVQTPLVAIMSLLKPYIASEMAVYQVSVEVNSVKNNHPGLIEPA